jgi:(2R)-3-sulfolactate dehydrogenase (NADP+)
VPHLTLAEARAGAEASLLRAGAGPAMAAATAEACVAAEATGQAGHGLSRIPQYAMLLRVGRADGAAVPRVVNERGGCCLVDAADGLAYPAMELAVAQAIARARDHGVACVGVTNSGHSGVSGLHAGALAEAGLVGLMFTNSPSAMPLPGGRRPRLSTNPVAAAFPREGGPPLVIDLALSATARGKIMVAAKEGRPIPPGWALDAEGRPTTDAKAALSGVMLAIGGDRGLALALMVELLAVALTGAAFGWEADSFFEERGNRPRLGQLLIAIDPAGLAGTERYLARLADIAAAAEEDGVRLPGARRAALGARAATDGIDVGDAVWDEIVSGGTAPPPRPSPARGEGA